MVFSSEEKKHDILWRLKGLNVFW